MQVDFVEKVPSAWDVVYRLKIERQCPATSVPVVNQIRVYIGDASRRERVALECVRLVLGYAGLTNIVPSLRSSALARLPPNSERHAREQPA